MAAENGEVCLEEGMSLIPSHILRDALDFKTQLGHQQQRHNYYKDHNRRPKLASDPHPTHSKYVSQRARPRGGHHRAKAAANGAAGGHGMRAVFIEYGQRSSGTGVFLPRTRPTSDFLAINIKSVCSPVLLPTRVVEALNLNVQELGLQLSPRQDTKDDTKNGDNDTMKSKTKNDVSLTQRYAISDQNESSSLEIFLPKEWTY